MDKCLRWIVIFWAAVLILMASVLTGCIASALNTGRSADGKSVGKSEVPADVVENIDETGRDARFVSVPDCNYVTYQMIFDCLGLECEVFDIQNMFADVTVLDFLKILASLDRYFIERDGEILYVLDDSNFMSRAEFEDLIARCDEKLDRNEFRDIMRCWKLSEKFLSEHAGIDDIESYEELLWGYYREFWDLYSSNPEKGSYWLSGIFDNDFSSDRYSSVLHEMAHEESARRANGYASKSYLNDQWRVVWFDSIQAFHTYNPKIRDFVNLDIQRVPKAQTALDLTGISLSVQDTEWFQTYVNSSDVISNLFGIYGMAEEFCASGIDIRYQIISSRLGYKTFTDDDLRPYYFWMSLICEYLTSLKERDYPAYCRILSDDALMGLLRDAHDYIEANINLVEIGYSNAWDSVALKSWFESNKIQMAVAEYF